MIGWLFDPRASIVLGFLAFFVVYLDGLRRRMEPRKLYLPATISYFAAALLGLGAQFLAFPWIDPPPYTLEELKWFLPIGGLSLSWLGARTIWRSVRNLDPAPTKLSQRESTADEARGGSP